MKDFQKVKRYGMITRYWHDNESWQEIGQDSCGEYVLYKDYLKLLEEKSPKRQASFEDVRKVLNKEIKRLENICFDIFKKENTINYSYAVSKFNAAHKLQLATDILSSVKGIMTDDECKSDIQ